MPDPVRYPMVKVATGNQLLFWGGVTHSDDERGYDFSKGYPPNYPGHFGTMALDGIAYDTATEAWEPIPAAPVPPLALGEVIGVWTGREMLVWGHVAGAIDAAGALYDPQTRQWRPMASQDLLVPGRGVWAGDRFVVVGHDRAWKARGAAYHPDTDSWSTLPDPPVRNGPSGPGDLLVWTGTELLASDDGDMHDIVRWRPGDDHWRPAAASPHADRSHSGFGWSGDLVFQFGGGVPVSDMVPVEGGMAVYDIIEDRWAQAKEPPTASPQSSYRMIAGRVVHHAYDTAESFAYDPGQDIWEPFPTELPKNEIIIDADRFWSLASTQPEVGNPYEPAVLMRYRAD